MRRIRFKIACSPPTAEKFFRDIRKTLHYHEQGREPLKGMLEMDESAFGGKRKGKRGWGAAGKILVFSIYRRNGVVHCSVIPNRKHPTIYQAIREHATSGSLCVTNDYQAYASFRFKGEHVVITKEKGDPK